MYDFRAKQTYLFIIFFLLGISVVEVRAQEVEMSQYWATPLDVNPAMAGISYGPRASVNYRNQWAGLGDGFNGGFTTYMASVDGYIPKAKSGIGLMYTGDYVANGLIGTDRITGAYAFQIKFSRKLGMRIGVEGSFIHRNIKWNNLTFSDMINPFTGFINNYGSPNPTQEPVPDQLNTYGGDAGAGILLFNNVWYVGFSMRDIIMPKASFYNGAADANMPFRFIGHAGANFNLKRSQTARFNVSLSPNLLVANQGKNVQFNIGMMASVSVVYFGTWFRYAWQNPDAVILVVGIKKGMFRLGYSYDITVSKMAGQTGGSHELSLIFNWSGVDDNSLNPHKNKTIDCPDILKF